MIDLTTSRHAAELRETWQGKALGHAREKMAALVLSVLAHNWPNHFPILMLVVYGSVLVHPPFYGSTGKIMHGGEVAADLVDKYHRRTRNALVFKTLEEYTAAWRRLADDLKLSDDERVAMMAAARAWIACDFRQDPNHVEAA